MADQEQRPQKLGSGFFRKELEDQHSNVKSLAGALTFFSVGLALGGGLPSRDTDRRPGSLGGERLLDDGRVHIFAVGVELTVAHRMLRSDE